MSEAYDVLKDEREARRLRPLRPRRLRNGGNGRRPGAGGFDFNFGAGFADIFDEMFGEFMGGAAARRAAAAAPTCATT